MLGYSVGDIDCRAPSGTTGKPTHDRRATARLLMAAARPASLLPRLVPSLGRTNMLYTRGALRRKSGPARLPRGRRLHIFFMESALGSRRPTDVSHPRGPRA